MPNLLSVMTRLASGLLAISPAVTTAESAATFSATLIPPLPLLSIMMPSSILALLFSEPVATAVKSSRVGIHVIAAVLRVPPLRMRPTLPPQLPSVPVLETPPNCLVALNLLPVCLGIGTGALSEQNSTVLLAAASIKQLPTTELSIQRQKYPVLCPT